MPCVSQQDPWGPRSFLSNVLQWRYGRRGLAIRLENLFDQYCGLRARRTLEALNTINGAIAAAVEEQSIVGWGRGGA
jgi:hypothetical protein